MASSAPTEPNAINPPVRLDKPYIRVDDKMRCACGVYAEGMNHHGDAACYDWPGCITD